MAVLLLFFNPQRSIRNIQNILTVEHYLKQANIPYYIHELAYNETPHLFAPTENVKLSRTYSYLCDKENMIRTLLPIVPAKYTKICIMDENLFFDEPDWYNLTSEALESYDVCQPFTSVYLLGPDYKPNRFISGSIPQDQTYVKALCRLCYETSARTLTDDACFTTCGLRIYQYYGGSTPTRTALAEEAGVTFEAATQYRKDGLLEWIPNTRGLLNTILEDSQKDSDLVKESRIGTSKISAPSPYNFPDIQDMAVVLTFFNPAQYNRSTQNIIMVRHWLEQAGIPYFIAEIAYRTNPFLFVAGPRVFQYRSDSNIFYKENLLDAIEPRIPAVYTKICLLDADILYKNPDWYARTSTLLDTCDICQPFTSAIWTHADFTEAMRRTHCLGSTLPILDTTREHQGFVWAFNREWYKTYPYRTIPICTSGGDTIIHDLLKKRNHHLYRYYKRYYDYIKTHNITANYAWLEAEVIHLHHGSLSNRLYNDYMDDIQRLVESCGVGAIPDAVRKRADGILEWIPVCKDALNSYNDTYFVSRHEDDI